jgi:hypothetical protein
MSLWVSLGLTPLASCTAEKEKLKIFNLPFISLKYHIMGSVVVDRHRFGADPDPDWHQNDDDPHTDPTQRFTHVGKQGK